MRLSMLMVMAMLTAATAGAQTAAPPADRTEIAFDQPVSVPVAKGSFLQLRVVTGQIEVTRAPGTDAIVTAVREAGATEPRLALVTDEKGLTICTVYPSPNPKKPNECLPKGKGRLNEGIKKDSPKVTLRVALPEGVLFVGRINIGSINASVGRSDLDLKTDFGDISIIDNGSETIWATIVTKGDLTARISPEYLKYQRDIRLTCAYGAMRVSIDESLPIEYQISAYGSIETPFTLEKPVSYTRTGRLGPDSVNYPPYVKLNLDALAMFARLYLLPIEHRRR